MVKFNLVQVHIRTKFILRQSLGYCMEGKIKKDMFLVIFKQFGVGYQYNVDGQTVPSSWRRNKKRSNETSLDR